MIARPSRLVLSRCIAGVACLTLLAASFVCAAEPKPATPDKDSPSIVGAWQVTSNTYTGKPSKDELGAVHVFHDGDLLEIYDPTYEARFTYRIVRPGVLQWAFGAKFSDCGVYRFDGDVLVWRIPHDQQPIDFKSTPKGKWNEYRMQRLQGKEAEEAIAKMKDARLTNKAKNSDESENAAEE